MTGYLLGIDFGTSNLRIHRSKVTVDGQPEPPEEVSLKASKYGTGTVPTVLELSPDGQQIRNYGETALSRLLQTSDTPSQFVQAFKPCIGQNAEDLKHQDKPPIRWCPKCQSPCSLKAKFCEQCGTRLPEDTTSDMIQFPYKQKEALHYTEILFEKVVHDLTERVYQEGITAEAGYALIAGVPVHWQQATREEFAKMLQRCFNNHQVHLTPEPEAALRYYLWQEQTSLSLSKDDLALVVDFGAGTTDLVLGRFSPQDGKLVETQTYGAPYGGRDFDERIACFIAERLRIPLVQGLPPVLRQEAKRFKEDMSEMFNSGTGQTDQYERSLSIPLGGQDISGRVFLDRPTFESEAVARKLIEGFKELLEHGLAKFQVPPEKVGTVITTGGGALWYFVKETLMTLFPEGRVKDVTDPQRAISKGLALTPLRGEHVSKNLTLGWEVRGKSKSRGARWMYRFQKAPRMGNNCHP